MSKEIYYHGMCRVNYESRAEKIPSAKHEKNAQALDEPNLGTSWHISRDLHCKTFEGICCLIDENVLSKRQVILLSHLNRQYQMLLAEYGGEDFEDVWSNPTRLEKKLLQHYKKQIKVIKGKTGRGSLVVSSEISDKEALRKENSMKTKLNAKIRDAAFASRQSILEAEKVPIPDEVKLADIIRGEVPIPDTYIARFCHCPYWWSRPTSSKITTEAKKNQINLRRCHLLYNVRTKATCQGFEAGFIREKSNWKQKSY